MDCHTNWSVKAVDAGGVLKAGVCNWSAFHFVPDRMGIGEKAFGVILADGRLKPAGAHLKAAYVRWREKFRTPWED